LQEKEKAMAVLDPVIPKVLATRIIPRVDPALAEAYGFDGGELPAVGLITCDLDDALYTALDEATKQAPVQIVYARSLYAGSGFPSGPTSGEILGVMAGADPDDVERGMHACIQCLALQALNTGMHACIQCLQSEAHFYSADDAGTLTFFPHVISSLGHYLSAEAGLKPGEAMAYLIATPLEAVYGVDAALKAAQVRLVKSFEPPTETNYAGAYLTGSLEACEAAAQAFAQAVVDIAATPNRLL
jgi:ethanolamine utilization protein EutL